MTGVDFAGPLIIKPDNQQAGENSKVYICLFTCATTRAVHLELVRDCHASTFLLALRRFFSRRTTPTVMYSDNATTFACIEQHLKAMTTDHQLADWIANNRIQWKFSASLAPWWGGFWERMVRSVKDLIRRSVGKASLTYDQLHTLLSEVEYAVNCRPITYVGEGDDDPIPLTPNQIITG